MLLLQKGLEAFGEAQVVMKPIQWHLVGLGGDRVLCRCELTPGEMIRTRRETFGVQWGASRRLSGRYSGDEGGGWAGHRVR